MKIKTNKRAIIILQLFLLILTGLFTIRGAGEVDTSFNASITGITTSNFETSVGTVTKILVQPDGKILVAGAFRTVNGVARSGLVRLNPDGTIDPSFALLDFRNTQLPGGFITDIALQSNGKILAGGDFVEINGVPRYRLVRINTNGTIDETFAPQPLTNTVNDIVVQPDDKIIIGGLFQYLSPNGNRDKIVRLNADGTLDTGVVYANQGFTPTELLVQASGKLVVATNGDFFRYNTDGSIDNTFGPLTLNGQVAALAAQADGKILVGGNFTNVNGAAIARLMRITVDGAIDPTFTSSGPNSNVNSIFVAPDGRIVIGGTFTLYSGTTRKSVAILNSNGLLDPTFNFVVEDNLAVTDAVMQADGKILVGSFASVGNPQPVRRTNADGTPDTTFNVTIRINGIVRKIFVQPDGKILVGGSFRWANEVSRLNLARFNADGTLDTAFVPYNFGSAFQVQGIDMQPDGKIIVGGRRVDGNSGGFIVRLNTNGSLDIALASQESGEVKVLPDGRILQVNQRAQLRLFNANGTVDTNFLVFADGDINKFLVQPDGRILIAGTFTGPRSRIARVSANGALDGSFVPPNINGEINDMALQPDGKIVIGGVFSSVNADNTRKHLARLNADGSLDTGFAPNIEAQPLSGYPAVSAVRLEPDGKILFGGNILSVNGAPRRGIARVKADGTLDTTFSVGIGTNLPVYEIELQADGKILYGGVFSVTNGFSTPSIGRLLNAATPSRTPFDYDGDGRADISVFRPAENKWYILQSSNASLRENIFGLAGDVPVPADFDGDGKTDIAIWRPSAGAWWYLSSINGQQVNVNFGALGDIPRPSDFDGDGKTDFVLYRPSNSVWYRMSATGIVAAPFAFGIAEDKPLNGDFDGDGKSDVAIFRPSSGDWWYAASASNNQFSVLHWGAQGDVPVPADVDADGKTDFVVYRPSNGGWYILRSGEQNYTILQFGTSEDKPVMADYDGDGKSDVAVFRPSTGTWYLLQTTSGFGAVQWGNSSDIPTENVFLP